MAWAEVTVSQVSREIAEFHDAWAAKWADKVTVEPGFDSPRSQYGETIVDYSAPEEAEREYWAGVQRILRG